MGTGYGKSSVCVSLSSLASYLQQVKEEESNEKSQLAQSCKIFHGWPTMALRKVSDSFSWSNKPTGEGE